MERLTEKITKKGVFGKDFTLCYRAYIFDGKVVSKLGQLEDLMEKYHIESVEDLEEIILASLLIL